MGDGASGEGIRGAPRRGHDRDRRGRGYARHPAIGRCILCGAAAAQGGVDAYVRANPLPMAADKTATDSDLKPAARGHCIMIGRRRLGLLPCWAWARAGRTTRSLSERVNLTRTTAAAGQVRPSPGEFQAGPKPPAAYVSDESESDRDRDCREVPQLETGLGEPSTSIQV